MFMLIHDSATSLTFEYATLSLAFARVGVVVVAQVHGGALPDGTRRTLRPRIHVRGLPSSFFTLLIYLFNLKNTVSLSLIIDKIDFTGTGNRFTLTTTASHSHSIGPTAL